MNFYENYVFLCNSIGKAPSAVAIEIGLSKPAVNRWKGGGVPTDATVRKVAKYFNIAPAVLMKADLPKDHGMYVYGTLLDSPDAIAGHEETKKTPTPEGEREIENQRIIEKLDSNEELRAAVLRFLGM